LDDGKVSARMGNLRRKEVGVPWCWGSVVRSCRPDDFRVESFLRVCFPFASEQQNSDDEIVEEFDGQERR
jgi:hypothetical protein